MLTFLVFIFSVWAFTGCATSSHYYYNTNSQQIPLFSEKKEFRLSGSFSKTKNTNCEEVQTSCALFENIAISGSAMASQFDEKKGSFINEKYFEACPGYYKILPNHLIFETYLGMGIGNQNHIYAKDTLIHWGVGIAGVPRDILSTINAGNASFLYYKYFVQPILGFKTKYFETGISCRLSSVYYSNINNNISPYYNEYNNLMNIQIHPLSIFCEPSLTIRAGINLLKIQLQITPPFQLSGPIMNIQYTNISFGMNLFLSKLTLGKKRN